MVPAETSTTTGKGMEANAYQVLTGEMLTFALLGKAFYVYPDRAWIQSLATEDVFAQAPFGDTRPETVAALELLQRWSRSLSEDTFDELCSDYTRLFIGPGKVLSPPWESVYFSEDRLTFQESTLQVREWFRRFGLESDKLYREPDDHIGLEFEFVAHLARHALRALEQNDQHGYEAATSAQRDFIAEHLRWAPGWCGQVETHAKTDFYRGMAMLARGAVAEAAFISGIEMAE
jgi:TorA maturation chaperone TorD